MKHLTDVYKTYQKYHGSEGPKEVPARVRDLVSDLQTKVETLPEAKRDEFHKQIEEIISKSQEKDMNNKLSALAVQVGKSAAGMAGGSLLGPVGGVITTAMAQYYATGFENAAKKEGGVIVKAEKVAGRRRAKPGSAKKNSPSPTSEAVKAAAKSTASASVGGIGGVAKSIWQGIKSLWGA